MAKAEQFRTLYCDPGEDFGWCQAVGFKLLSRGIEKMWPTVHEIANDLELQQGTMFNDPESPFICDGIDPEEAKLMCSLPIRRIVCEDFRIYPWAEKQLRFNPVRTARAIGAITFLCQRYSVEFVLQPAAIKKAAKAAGAEEFFDSPLYENRHSNDAIMHYVFYTNTALRGIQILVPNEGVQGEDNGGVDDVSS